MNEAITVDAIQNALTESFTHRFVDPREPYYDTPGFGWMARRMGLYTRIDFRSHGRFAPVYDNELDLRAVRMASWLADAEVPVAKGMKNRRTDYTIASGFDWSISCNSERLSKKLTEIVDDFFEDSDWLDVEAESFDREQVDGEFCAELVESEGQLAIEILEGDNLTEPMGKGLQQELSDWKGYEFPTEWSFGVLTERGRAKPQAYHVCRNMEGTDFDVVEPDRFIHWKRNVTRNAKRGVPDSFTPHKWLRHGDKVLDRTAVGSAIQASIAYIVEHAASTSPTQAAALARARSNVVVKNDPITGGNYKQRTMAAGTVLDVKNGQKYQHALLGSNASTIYMDVMEACFRLCGVIDAFPEHMLTGYAGNNNMASSETAESPFVQGRKRNQRTRGRRLKQLIELVIKFHAGTKGVPEWEDLKNQLNVTVTSPDIIHRDVNAMTESILKQREAGLLSSRGAANALNIDFEENQQQIEEETEEAIKKEQEELGRPSFQGERQPPMGAPGSIPGAKDPATPVEAAPPGEEEEDPSVVGPAESDVKEGIETFPLGTLLDEGFDPMKHPRGKDGKFIHTGVHTGSWKASNTAAQWGIKKINAMKSLAADGKWDELGSIYSHPISKKTGKPTEKLNQYQKGVLTAQKNLLKLKDKWNNEPIAKSKPAPGKPEALSPAGWVRTGKKLGSNPGGTFTGPDGGKYYVKQPANTGHAHAEVLATKLYKAAGAGVVDADLVMIEGKTAIAAKWLEGSEKLKWTAGDKVEAAEDFAVHAWLGNWDAVGHPSEKDNIRFHDGKLVAVDVGGSLNYRAQGAFKYLEHDAPEWDTLRDPKKGASAASVFGNMTNEQLISSVSKLSLVTDSQIDVLVDKYHKPTAAYSKQDMKTALKMRKIAIIEKASYLKSKSELKAESVPAPATPAPKKAVVNSPKKSAKADTLGAMDTNVPVALPPKIVLASTKNASYQKHFDALHALAVKGDAEGLAAYKTNATSKQTYAKKLHKHKLDLMQAVGGGAVVPKTKGWDITPSAPAAAAPKKKAAKKKTAKGKKPTAETFKVNASAMPVHPTFFGTYAKDNDAVALSMKKAAEANDVAKVTALAAKSKSPKAKAYALALKTNLKNQLEAHLNPPTPPTPPEPYAPKAVLQAASKLKATPAGAEKVGHWVVHGTVESTAPKAPIKENWKGLTANETKTLMNKGLAQYNSLPATQKKALKNYTGGSYGTINRSLRKGEPTPQATAAAKALKAASIPLPQGTTFGRRHALTPEATKTLLKLKPGSVVSDPAVLSTSVEKTAWGGKVHWRFDAAPGAKAIPANNFSKNSGTNEAEVIVPPGSRFVVHKVEKVPPAKGYANEKVVVFATMLEN